MKSEKDYKKEQADLLNQQKVNVLTLKRLKVLDESGQEVRFGTFLQAPSITIVFVRHFGCIACRAHVDQIWNIQKKQKNNRIIFIGSGSPYVIASFKEVMGVEDAEIYTDPSLETFDACGMVRGVFNLVNFKTISAMRTLKNKGYQQGPFKDSGTHRQMGGVVIFRRPGLVSYHYASEYLGDFDNSNDWDYGV